MFDGVPFVFDLMVVKILCSKIMWLSSPTRHPLHEAVWFIWNIVRFLCFCLNSILPFSPLLRKPINLLSGLSFLGFFLHKWANTFILSYVSYMKNSILCIFHLLSPLTPFSLSYVVPHFVDPIDSVFRMYLKFLLFWSTAIPFICVSYLSWTTVIAYLVVLRFLFSTNIHRAFTTMC